MTRSHHLEERFRHVGRSLSDADARLPEGFDLGGRSAFAAAHNCPRMSHAAARRSGGSRNEPGDGFRAVLLDPLGGFLLRASPNLTDHDDSVCVRILHEQLDGIQMRSAIDRVSSDANTRALPNAAAGQLPDRLIGQRAGAADHADVAFLVNVTGRDVIVSA